MYTVFRTRGTDSRREFCACESVRSDFQWREYLQSMIDTNISTDQDDRPEADYPLLVPLGLGLMRGNRSGLN